MQTRRWLSLATLSLLAALSLSCGGGRSSLASAPKPTTPLPVASNPLGAALPSPASLLSPGAHAASGATLLCHYGSETDPALAPQHAVADGATLNFTPDWTPGQQQPSGLALALYRFTVAGYTGATELQTDWTGPASVADHFLAVADFPRDRWTFLPVGVDGKVVLTADQFSAATAPGSLEVLAVAIVVGNQPSQLGAIRIGANQGPLNITGVTPTTVPQYRNAIFSPVYTGEEPASWEWTFDGASLSGIYPGRMPEVYIVQLGIHHAVLTATDAHGVKTVFPFTLTVVPLSNFAPELISVMPNAGETGTQTSIIGTAQGGAATSYSWNFGGGATPNTSSAQYPVITFGAPGVYDATATFTNGHGSSTYPFKLYVVAAGGELPPCLYSAGTNSDPAQPGMTVSFNVGNVGGAATSYSWDFGGGALPNTSTEAAPSVVLPAAGIFHGTVTAMNAVGNSSVGFTLNVLQPAAPHLTSVTVPNAQTLLPLNLTPLGDGGGVVTYNWNFGGAGLPNTSSDYIPQIIPQAAGTYHASVVASNSAGTCKYLFDIVVKDPAPPHLTGLNQSELTTTIETALFAVNDGGLASSWSWDFGGANGAVNTSTEYYPYVTPMQAGVYHGSVTATNMSGSSTVDITLTVTDMAPPVIDAVFPAAAVEGQSVCFSVSTQCGFPMTFSWDFGGGCTPNLSTDTNPVVEAGVPATVNGTVTATNAGGSTTFPFVFTIQPNTP